MLLFKKVSPEVLRRYKLTQHGFLIEGDWLISIKETSKGKKRKRVANILVWPTKQVVKYNNHKVERHIYLKGKIIGKKSDFKEIRLSIDELNKNLTTQLAQHWGADVIVDCNKELSTAIKVLCAGLKEIKIYTHTGWQMIDNQRVFLHAGGAIGAADVQVELTESEPKLQRYCLPDKCEDSQQAANAALRFLEVADPEITFPLFAMAFYAPLHEPLSPDLRPNFFPFLLGKSQSGKSTMAALALSFFGDFDTVSFPMSFRDTVPSVEIKCWTLKDVLQIADDYYPPNTAQEKVKQKEVAEALGRLYGDQAPKSRSSGGTKLKETFLARGAIFGTGENKPDISQSGLNRYLFIDVTRERVYIEEANKLKMEKGLLAECMLLYLNWVNTNWDRITELFANTYYNILDNYTSNIPEGRIKQSVAKLCATLDIVATFLFESGLMTEEECKSRFEKGAYAIISVGEKNNAAFQPVDHVALFIEAIYQLISSQKGNLASIDEKEIPECHIGYHDEDYVYFYPQRTIDAVQNYIVESDISYQVPTKIWSLLKEAKVIICSGSRHKHPNTVQKKFNGKYEEFIQMPKDILRQIENANNQC